MDTPYEIVPFSNAEFGELRVLAIDDEPWFVAKDICDVLGVATNHLREKNRGLDSDEVMSLPNWEGKGSAPLIVLQARAQIPQTRCKGIPALGDSRMLTQSGFQIGQNRLFALLREEGYLGKSGSNRNVPIQRYVEQGLFRIKETAITHSDGHVTLTRTAKVTGKGQAYFVARYCGEAA